MTDREPFLKKGYTIPDPEDGSRGYRLTRDVFSADPVRATDYEPFGGAPEPIPGMKIPPWLAKPVCR